MKWRNNVNPSFYDAANFAQNTYPVGLYDLPRVNPGAPNTTTIPPKQHIIGSLILDLICIIILFGFVGIFYFYNTPSPYFTLNDIQYSYPLVQDIVSSLWMGIINWVAPLLILILCEVFFFGMYKWNMIYVIKAFAETMVIALLIPAIVWCFYPSLRPNFYAVCNPNPSLMQPINGIWYTISICQNKISLSDLDGFPSGHASTAWSAWLFVSFYLWARLKPFDYTAHLWKAIIVFLLPLILVVWECITRLTDYYHSPIQIFWGSIVGIIGVFFGYRMNHLGYPWSRFGHITTGGRTVPPLPPLQ
jgi:membrane-associated phospholipid phosphatase